MENLRVHIVAQGREAAQLAMKIKKERGLSARIQRSRPRPQRTDARAPTGSCRPAGRRRRAGAGGPDHTLRSREAQAGSIVDTRRDWTLG